MKHTHRDRLGYHVIAETSGQNDVPAIPTQNIPRVFLKELL